jgi:hypothetical protein
MDTAATPPPARRFAGARVAALVAAGLIGLLALGLLAVGGVSLWGDAHKDEQGYLSTGTDRFATSTSALVTDDLDIDSGAHGWPVNADRYGKVRLQVNSHAGKQIFVGIAPTSDVSSYLRHSAHAVVTDVSYSPFRAHYRGHGGDRRPTAPGAERFWAASAHGSGRQTLIWDVKHGSWSVVVMNADGSAGVDAGVRAGANVPILATIGWGAIGGGLILLAAAGGLVFVAVRTPRADRRDADRLDASLDATPAPVG